MLMLWLMIKLKALYTRINGGRLLENKEVLALYKGWLHALMAIILGN